MDPTRGMSGNDRAVTRCLRLLHETPTQWQKDVPVVQLLARMRKGSVSWALKASSAARSVPLPLPLVGLGEEAEAAKNRTSIKMEIGADMDGVAIELGCLPMCGEQLVGVVTNL